MARLKSWFKLFVGMTLMAVIMVIVCTALILLLPSRSLRIKTCNVAAHAVGPFYVWLGGCRTPVTGREHLDSSRPAIYRQEPNPERGGLSNDNDKHVGPNQ